MTESATSHGCMAEVTEADLNRSLSGDSVHVCSISAQHLSCRLSSHIAEDVHFASQLVREALSDEARE